MKKFHNSKPESFVKSPVYPGGKDALNEFIKSNLKYPDTALENKIEGIVAVEHDIDANGDVLETKLKHGIGYGCDEEAMRIVRLLKYNKKKYRGLRVVFHNVINIHFKIHSASPVNEIAPVLNYNISYSPEVKTENPEKVVYNITINL